MNTKELRKNNNELDKLLTNENSGVMTDMVVYLRGSSLSELDQEIVRQDLLDMVLSAQKRGGRIQSVIGSDFKHFCDEIITNVPAKSPKYKILDTGNTIFLSLSVLLLIHSISGSLGILFQWLKGQAINLTSPFNVGNMIVFPIILAAAYAVVYTMTKNSFRKKERKLGAIITITLTFCVVTGLSVLLAVSDMGKTELFRMNLIMEYFTALLFFAISILFNRLKEKGKDPFLKIYAFFRPSSNN